MDNNERRFDPITGQPISQSVENSNDSSAGMQNGQGSFNGASNDFTQNMQAGFSGTNDPMQNGQGSFNGSANDFTQNMQAGFGGTNDPMQNGQGSFNGSSNDFTQNMQAGFGGTNDPMQNGQGSFNGSSNDFTQNMQAGFGGTNDPMQNGQGSFNESANDFTQNTQAGFSGTNDPMQNGQRSFNGSANDFNAQGGFNAGEQGGFNAYNQQYNSNMNNGSKRGKLIITVIVAIAVLFGAYKGYDYFFGGNKIDLANNIVIKVAGEHGNGYITGVTNNVNYDKSNTEISTFVSSLRYTYSKSAALSNGDKVTVTVIYDQTRAKALKLKVTGVSKTIVIKSLPQRFASVNEVPKDLAGLYKPYADQKIRTMFINSSSITYQYDYDSVWFQKSKLNNSTTYTDRVIFAYKITAKNTSGQTASAYYGVQFSNINSRYKTAVKTSSAAGRLYFTSGTRTAVTDSSQIQQAFTNSTYDASKIE